MSHNDDGSSTSSEKYERDVAILNSCFDDIERFIARLQHTAAATRELEHRRRSVHPGHRAVKTIIGCDGQAWGYTNARHQYRGYD